MPHFIKLVAVEYGPAIPDPSLRNAIVAWAAQCLPPEQFQRKFELYRFKARRNLITKLRAPDTVGPPDIFAAILLAWLSHCSSPVESAAHTSGCMSMLRYLANSLKHKPLSRLLSALEPLVWDTLNVLNGVSALSITGHRKTFNEVARCFEDLPWTGIGPRPRLGNRVQALYMYINRLFLVSFSWLKSGGLCEDGRDSSVELIVQHMKTQLGDFEFRATLASLGTSSPHQYDIYEAIRGSAYYAKLHAVELLLVAFEERPILSFSSPNAIALANSILEFAQSPILQSVSEWHGYTADYCLLLTMSALALPNDLLQRGFVRSLIQAYSSRLLDSCPVST